MVLETEIFSYNFLELATLELNLETLEFLKFLKLSR